MGGEDSQPRTRCEGGRDAQCIHPQGSGAVKRCFQGDPDGSSVLSELPVPSKSAARVKGSGPLRTNTNTRFLPPPSSSPPECLWPRRLGFFPCHPSTLARAQGLQSDSMGRQGAFSLGQPGLPVESWFVEEVRPLRRFHSKEVVAGSRAHTLQL